MDDTRKHYPETASQTAGPYVHIGLTPDMAGLETHPPTLGKMIAHADVPGTRIAVTGTIFDGDATPVTDALIEIWQADGNGNYPGTAAAHPKFAGWGRALTDSATGQFALQTIKPGAVALTGGSFAAPHLSLWIVARGINIGLSTRLYFADEAEANAKDPLLLKLKGTGRTDTLIARRDGGTYRFNIHLQGPEETVFLDV